MTARHLMLLLLFMGCKPARTLSPTALPVKYQTDDPRCVPDSGDFSPQIFLTMSDGGTTVDDRYLMWDVMDLRFTGLPPCWEVDFTFELAQGGFSSARFRSGYDGVVSTLRDAPVSGSWSVSDPDGPLWSMAGDTGGDPDVAVTADYGGPFGYQLVWQRRTAARDVDVLPVRGYKGVYGDLYLPPGRPPFPGVVVIGDGEGGLRFASQLAKQLASQGVLALAVAYFDPSNASLPATLTNIPLEYFVHATELLKEYPDYHAGHLGLVGTGRGAEAALLVASRLGGVQAVVGIVGSGVVWPAFDTPRVPSWTFADAGVAFLPRAMLPTPTRTNDAGQTVQVQRSLFTQSVQQASANELWQATVPVEQINGAVLLLAAQDDQSWPSCELSRVAWDRLRDAGHDVAHPTDGYECYPAAGHALSPANVGLPMGDADQFQDDGGIYAWGGTAQGLGHGNRLAFERLRDFLDRTLK